MFFVYANANTTNANVANLIVGTWWSPITIGSETGRVSISYSADGNLSIVISSVVANKTIIDSVAGTWSINGEVLTFTDTDCGDEPGYYKITSIDNNSMQLGLISDTCEGRGVEVSDHWTRE